jgi:hypothetical protein
MTLIAQTTELDLGQDAIKGAGVIGETTQKYATSPRSLMDLLLDNLSNIIGFLTLLGGLFFVLYFILAAFDWLRAGGDHGKIEKAQQKMVNAAIGLLIMIVGIGIVGIVGGVFGLEILDPTDTYLELVEK